MLSIVDLSLELAAQRVRFFRVITNSKLPAVDRFSDRATSDAKELKALFNEGHNSGIACGKVGEGLYLVGVDVDHKPGKPGYETLANMEILGQEFPPTWAQRTPSGGEHRLFWSPVPIRQGTDVMGLGIDLRGDGGYLVGPGSSINGKFYEPLNHLEIARLPEWAIEMYRRVDNVVPITKNVSPLEIDAVAALKRAVAYLKALPVTAEGNRNNEGYKVVCRLKDMGIQPAAMPEILHEYWACRPMLEDEEIVALVNSAFKYGNSKPASDTPEAVFDKIPTPPSEPIGPPQTPDDFNRDHFLFVGNGTAKVCWETRDETGHFRLDRMHVEHFHLKHSAVKALVAIGEHQKLIPATKAWLNSPTRRTYDTFRFLPQRECSPGTYNLWKGFAVKPADPAREGYAAEAHAGRDAFHEHLLKNVCQGDQAAFKWIFGFFAHLFQKPGERPRVCLVFQGAKGAGKNMVVDRIASLIGDHSVVLSNRKHVGSNFNSLMEDKLLIGLDESFWSGDKSMDGFLKGLVTEKVRVIERKGEEAYITPVFDRIVILGNEDRLVNATGDDRRWAVFEVSGARKDDSDFFETMIQGLEKHGGNELLMRDFLDFDLTTVNVNRAPNTRALADQKTFSLPPADLWWKECLIEQRILGTAIPGWPEKIGIHDLHAACAQYHETHRHFGHPPSVAALSKTLSKLAPRSEKKFIWDNGKSQRGIILSPLADARADWDKHMGFKEDWGD